MAAATSLPATVGLLGTELIAHFEITRGQLGLVIGLTMFVGGVCSPLVGALTDRLGGRKALAVMFSSAALAYAVMAGATVYLLLLGAAIIGGLGNGLSNPATNKLIATEVVPGRRAVITGIKQSGVQVGAALLGLLVPLGVLAWGWRLTVLSVGIIWLMFLPVTFAVTSPVAAVPRVSRQQRASTLKDIWPVSLYGLSLGITAAVILLLPLYTEEALGFTRVNAGRVAALAAVAAVLGRLTWARRAERRQAFAVTLRLMAWLAIGALATIAAAVNIPWLIWVGATAIGLSAGSWNAVGMLATIVTAGPSRAGAAAGWVQLGFLSGVGLSSPFFGWLVDQTHSYMPVMLVAAVAALGGSLVVTRGTTVLGERPPEKEEDDASSR